MSLTQQDLEWSAKQGERMERLLAAEQAGQLDEALAAEAQEASGYGMVEDNPLVGALQAAMPQSLAQRMTGTELGYQVLGSNEPNTPFTDWLVAPAAAPPPPVNCWEAILFSAVEHGLTTKAALAQAGDIEEAGRSSEKLAINVLNYAGAAPLQLDGDGRPTNVAADDVLFFMGLTHVALARDAQGGVAQLWGDAQRETTITDILERLRGTMSAQQLRVAAGTERNGVTGDRVSGEAMAGMYDREDAGALREYLIAQGFAEVRVARPQWP